MARLSDWLRSERSVEERAALVAEIATTLVAVHENDSAYGGLTPEYVTVGDGVDIGDNARGFRVTPTPYQAPEATAGARPTPRADIYSAGVLFYEILSGHLPSGTPPAPLKVPRDLADAVMVCLERDPEWRPKDLTYLAEIAGKVGGTAVKARPAAAPAAVPAPAAKSGSFKPMARTSAPPPAPKASSTPAVVGIAVVAVAAAAGAWLMFGRGPAPAPATTVAAATATTAAPVTEVATPPPATTATAAPATTAPATAATPTPPPTTAAAKPTAAPVTVATAAPVTAPTPAPAATAAPATTPPTTVAAAPAPPAQLTAVSPPYLRRPSTGLLDVRGTGIRPEHQARIGKQSGGSLTGITILKSRYVDPTTLQVFVKIEESAAFGQYVVLLADPAGATSNAVPLVISNSEVKVPVKK